MRGDTQEWEAVEGRKIEQAGEEATARRERERATAKGGVSEELAREPGGEPGREPERLALREATRAAEQGDSG